MKQFLFTTLLLIAITGTAAADTPDFSGEWKMNASKSNYGAQMPPISFIRNIEHNEPMITIVEEQTGSMTPYSSRSTTTDGQIKTEDMQGAEIGVSAAWEGRSLLVTTSIELMGVTFKDLMTMSDDRNTLTSEVTLETVQGNIALSIVFERQ